MIVGTFAALSPSFMVGAHAQQFYGMDQRYNSYEPEYGMERTMTRNNHMEKIATATINPKIVYVTVKKIKCNNINANLNGFSGNEIGASQALGALATISTSRR